MPLYKLLAGEHVGPDYDADPVDVVDPVTGKVTQEQPSRHWRQGEVINSGPQDLAGRLGANKFQLLGESGGKRGKRGKAEEGDDLQTPLPSMVAPHGQVSQGHQVASTTAEGQPSSRAMTAEESAEAGLTQPVTMKNAPNEMSKSQGKTVDGKDAAKETKESKKKLSEQYSLEDMTKAELQELAEAEEVDLKGCHTKEDILKVMKKH